MAYSTTRTAPASLDGRFVRLEALSPRHVEGLAAVGLDEEIWRWMPSAATTPQAMRALVGDALAARARGAELPFATIERAGGTVVGSTRFLNIDAGHRRVEIGWTWIAPPWQRTAINSEAKLLMLRHAFEVMGCIRVELKTDALNARSRAAIARLGAREEGTLRKHMITASGRVRDTVYYSILEEEWPEVEARLERALGEKKL